MPATFLYSDPHFGHAGVCKFMRADGVTKLRPWDDPDEMDEEMVKRFNERVRPKDKVYFLGDVAINRKALATVLRLNGDKVLIRGNHDIFRDEEYTKVGFRSLRACHVMNNYLLSHIPIHPESLSRWKGNWHGHTHANSVMRDLATAGRPNVVDPRYMCLCVEQTDFRPILFERARDRFNEQMELSRQPL
jgi:calcineurin-like phosphoesterase family protein